MFPHRQIASCQSMPPLPGPILRACCNSRSLECRPGQKIVPGRSQLFPLQGILSSFDHRAFPGQGDARGAAPEQQTRREHAGTVSYSEYHPFAVRPGTGPDQRGYCIIRPDKSKGFFSGFFPAECTTFSPLFRQSPTKKEKPPGRVPRQRAVRGPTEIFRHGFSWCSWNRRLAKPVRSLALSCRRNLGFRSPRRTRSRLSASLSRRVSSRAWG